MFKQVKICEMFELCDVVEHLRHFGGVVSSLLYSDKTTWLLLWKIRLETPWKFHF